MYLKCVVIILLGIEKETVKAKKKKTNLVNTGFNKYLEFSKSLYPNISAVKYVIN